MDMQELESVITRLMVAVVLSGLLGLERERRGRAAGLRTHVLVCLGSTLAIIFSDLITKDMAGSGAQVWLDKGRVAAGIITGIGFLGGGTILKQGGTQRGLTTAAMIWFAAILGVGVGEGYFVLSTIATGFALGSVYGLQFLERFIPSHERLSIKVRYEGQVSLVHAIEKHLEDKGYRLLHQGSRITQEGSNIEISIEVGSNGHPDVPNFINELTGSIPAIQEVEVDY